MALRLAIWKIVIVISYVLLQICKRSDLLHYSDRIGKVMYCIAIDYWIQDQNEILYGIVEIKSSS